MAHGTGNTEVSDLDLTAAVDEDIARLHVAVDNSAAVGKIERAGHVGANCGGAAGSDGPWRIKAERVWPSMYSMTMK